MKYFLILFIFWSQFSIAAISNTMVWEVRSAATSGNVNGGGFDPGVTSPGTDKSQSNTAAYGFSDLASTNGNTNPCVVTSASHTFDSTDVGNTINLNNNGTNGLAGVYEIMSVSAGAATLDRACGSAATVSGVTYKVGGAWSLQNGSGDQTFISTYVVKGNTFWIKAGTYTETSVQFSFLTGDTTHTTTIVGYNSTRGDNPQGTNRPLFTGNSFTIIVSSYTIVKNLQIVTDYTNSGHGPLHFNGNNNRGENLRLIARARASAVPAVVLSSFGQLIDSELVSYGSYGVQLSTDGTRNLQIENCWFHDSVYGIYDAYAGAETNIEVHGSVFENMTTGGIYLDTGSFGNYNISGNTFYGGETTKVGTGFTIVGTTGQMVQATNNIFYGLATGISTPIAGTNFSNYNDFYNNTADVSGVVKGPNDLAINPNFKNVGQYTGTSATSSGSVLTDSGANFSNVVNNSTYLYVVSATGVTAGIYGITSHTSTTLTTDNSLGTGSGITYIVVYGNDFTPTNTGIIQAGGMNTPIPGISNYRVIGAYSPQYTDPGTSNVRNLTNYTFGGASKTGTLTGGGFPKRPGGRL